jgi:hypothetical protein
MKEKLPVRRQEIPAETLDGRAVETRERNKEDIMIAEVIATVENGALKLDEALPFPDQTRVKLTIEPLESTNPSAVAWQRLKEHIRQHPIPGLAGKFAREELYEHD